MYAVLCCRIQCNVDMLLTAGEEDEKAGQWRGGAGKQLGDGMEVEGRRPM